MAFNPERSNIIPPKMKDNHSPEKISSDYYWYNLAPLIISGAQCVCQAQPIIPQGCLKITLLKYKSRL
jgi:hypothetical protein